MAKVMISANAILPKYQLCSPIMYKTLLALLLSAFVSTSAYGVSPLKPTDTSITTAIESTFQRAGLNAPIASVVTTPIKGLYQVNIKGSDVPILTEAEGKYLTQGTLEPNPSFLANAAKKDYPTGVAGTPISQDHKNALLGTMKALKNIDKTTAFYHTNIDGLLWGVSGAGGVPFLVSKDGHYFVNGDIATIQNGQYYDTDIDFERTKNRHVLNTLSDSELAIYPAKGTPKAIVYIATDIHCPYCRIFHNQIPTLNAKGITVKAIGYPVYPESGAPMREIWCEADPIKRATLLSSAMKGVLPKNQCKGKQSPLPDIQTRAHSLGVFATPAIYNAQGELFYEDFTGSEFLTFLGL